MSNIILFVVFTILPFICLFGFLGFYFQQTVFCSDEEDIWVEVDVSAFSPAREEKRAEAVTVLTVILSIFLFIGCSSEEPTCEDYTQDQLSMMESIADREEYDGTVVEYCWTRGLDIDLQHCSCMPLGAVEEFALRRCTPAEFSWLHEAASLAVGSCDEEFSHR